MQTKTWTPTGSERSGMTMYSQDKIDIPLQVYHQCGSCDQHHPYTGVSGQNGALYMD